MKPSVKHIEGRHLTASDKRNILACIEYLRNEENHALWLGRPRSKRQYCVAADPEAPNRFSVLIRETYTSDHGQRRQSQSRHVVETRGVDPLPAADWSIAQLELFQGGEA